MDHSEDAENAIDRHEDRLFETGHFHNGVAAVVRTVIGDAGDPALQEMPPIELRENLIGVGVMHITNPEVHQSMLQFHEAVTFMPDVAEDLRSSLSNAVPSEAPSATDRRPHFLLEGTTYRSATACRYRKMLAGSPLPL